MLDQLKITVCRFADKLMLSEWLVDIPESLSAEWTMVMAPQGKRTLVVAANVEKNKNSEKVSHNFQGYTTAYNKAGRQVSQFQSQLPGGSTRNKSKFTHTC